MKNKEITAKVIINKVFIKKEKIMENGKSIKNPILGLLACITIITCVLSIITLLKVGKIQNELKDTTSKVKEIHNSVVIETQEIEWDYEDRDI